MTTQVPWVLEWTVAKLLREEQLWPPIVSALLQAMTLPAWLLRWLVKPLLMEHSVRSICTQTR
jgi:hypothetical protein